jgi:putative aldouronate transport system substrate-binding protein
LVTFMPWINKVWLDQLGLSMPTTPAEFKQVLIAFRDRIPNINNQRIIPFSADANNYDIGIFAGWWGVNGGGGRVGGGFAVINGVIETTLIRPEYREAIKFFADLYRERLIDPELFTQDLETWKAKGRLGLYGSCYGYGPSDWVVEIDPAQKASDPSRNWDGWVPLPVLRASPNVAPVYRNNNNGNSLFSTQFVITDKAGDARAANIMKWLDALYQPIHAHEHVWGPLGFQWEIVSQVGGRTTWTVLDTSEIERTNRDYYDRNDWGGYAVPSLPRYRLPAAVWIRQPRLGWENEYRHKDVADALYKPFLEAVPMPAVWFSEAQSRRVTDIRTAIGEYVSQKTAEWVSGQANIDAEWDAYVAQLNRIGLQELLAMTRSAASL